MFDVSRGDQAEDVTMPVCFPLTEISHGTRCPENGSPSIISPHTCLSTPALRWRRSAPIDADGLDRGVERAVLFEPGLASSIRSFDADTGAWAIWWLDQRNPTPSMYSLSGPSSTVLESSTPNDTLNAQPITMRFRWFDMQFAPRWTKHSLPTGARRIDKLCTI